MQTDWHCSPESDAAEVCYIFMKHITQVYWWLCCSRTKKNTIIYFQVTLISIKYSYCVFFQLHRSGSVLTDSYGVLSLQSPELLKLMLQRQIQLRSRFTGDWQRYLLMCSECFSANLSYMTSVLCLKLCLFFCLCEHHFCSSLYFWMWEMCCLMMNCKLYFSPP